MIINKKYESQKIGHTIMSRADYGQPSRVELYTQL